MSESTRFAIAVHVLAVLGYLEQQGVELVSSSLIAGSVNTNAVVIRHLLRALKKAGLVHAKEGRGGGVRLARRPSRITLKEIFLAVEEGGIFAASDKPHFEPCPVSRGMREAFLWISKEVDGAVARALAGKTLQDVLRRMKLPS